MKTLIVTGASGGIGKAVAEKFLDQGWTVGLIARRAPLLEELAKDRLFEQFGGALGAAAGT